MRRVRVQRAAPWHRPAGTLRASARHHRHPPQARTRTRTRTRHRRPGFAASTGATLCRPKWPSLSATAPWRWQTASNGSCRTSALPRPWPSYTSKAWTGSTSGKSFNPTIWFSVGSHRFLRNIWLLNSLYSMPGFSPGHTPCGATRFIILYAWLFTRPYAMWSNEALHGVRLWPVNHT